MKSRIPKTYNEVIRKKRCYELAKYFDVTNELLVDIYDFLGANKQNRIVTTQNMITFYTGNNMIKNISVSPINNTFDGITMSDNKFVIIPHYTPSDSSGSSGGSSSNYNTNNNNNNNS